MHAVITEELFFQTVENTIVRRIKYQMWTDYRTDRLTHQ